MSNFSKIAKAIATGKINEVDMPTPNLNKRRLTTEEVKQLVSEEFEKAKDVCDVKAEELPWADSELENHVDFMKALNIKEFLIKK